MNIEAQFQQCAQQCLLDFNRLIASATIDVVDNHIIPELMKSTDCEYIARRATTLLRSAAAELAKEVPLDEVRFLQRLVARFKQHINGDCEDDETYVKALLEDLRVVDCGVRDYMVIYRP